MQYIPRPKMICFTQGDIDDEKAQINLLAARKDTLKREWQSANAVINLEIRARQARLKRMSLKVEAEMQAELG